MHVGHFILGRCNPDRAIGPNRVVFELARHQVRLGFQVTVYAIPRPGVKEPPTENEGVRYVFYPRSRMRIFMNRSLRETLRSNKDHLDAGHLHGTFVPELARIGAALRTCNVPYVVSVHGGLNPYALRHNRIKKWPYFRLVEHRLLRNAAALHLLSRNEEEYLDSLRLQVRSFVIPYGVNLPSVPKAPASKNLKNRASATRGTIKILYVGRLSIFTKGLDLLIRGFARALRGVAPEVATLFLVGPEENNSIEKLRQLANQTGVSRGIVFLGPAYGQEKLRLLQDCDFFVHTSRHEGMPNAVLEALACGKPCLVTEQTNLGGFIRQYKAGQVVRSDVADIADGLEELIRNRQTLLEMGQNAERLVQEKLTWEKIAAEMANEYRVIATGIL